MSEIDSLRKALEEANAKANAERLVMKLILQTTLARLSRLDDDPEQYVMSLIAPILEGIDSTVPKSNLERTVFSRAANFAQEIETAVLEQLEVQ